MKSSIDFFSRGLINNKTKLFINDLYIENKKYFNIVQHKQSKSLQNNIKKIYHRCRCCSYQYHNIKFKKQSVNQQKYLYQIHQDHNVTHQNCRKNKCLTHYRQKSSIHPHYYTNQVINKTHQNKYRITQHQYYNYNQHQIKRQNSSIYAYEHKRSKSQMNTITKRDNQQKQDQIPQQKHYNQLQKRKKIKMINIDNLHKQMMQQQNELINFIKPLQVSQKIISHNNKRYQRKNCKSPLIEQQKIKDIIKQSRNKFVQKKLKIDQYVALKQGIGGWEFKKDQINHGGWEFKKDDLNQLGQFKLDTFAAQQ